MSQATESKLESDRQLLREAGSRGGLANLRAYFKLSGPGWLQSALTLGGGSLSSSLYLGVLAGFSLLWLQPLAMVLGIIMLSAIGHVTLSTGERPFQAINRHVNPVLGWGWALASLAANVVWVLPQYSLASGVLEQNLLPGVLGRDSVLGDFWGKVVISACILAVTIPITWSYDRGGRGVRLYELTLKLVVALIVVCFFGVVLRLSFSDAGLPWASILASFVPDFSTLVEPAATFTPLLDATGRFSDYWSSLIVESQRDVLIAAAATAVGINMTFLFPYSLLKRGWGREFRGLAIFDLGTGMLIPFLLATSCVVIASASQFHAAPQPGLVSPLAAGAPAAKLAAEYETMLRGRLAEELGAAELEALEAEAIQARLAELPEADRLLAATLVKRDAKDLAQSLKPFLGDFFANIVFGIGVLAMALSTITLLMLISGMVICEILGRPASGTAFRLGTLAAATGVLGPFFWNKAAFWLAVPTSVFGFTLLPIAYLTFFFLMNQKSLLRDDRPEGGKRLAWNILMGISAGIATFASVYMVWQKAGSIGIAAVVAFALAAVAAHFVRRRSAPPVS